MWIIVKVFIELVTIWTARKVPSELVFYGLSFYWFLHVDVNKLGCVCAHFNVKLIAFDFLTQA